MVTKIILNLFGKHCSKDYGADVVIERANADSFKNQRFLKISIYKHKDYLAMLASHLPKKRFSYKLIENIYLFRPQYYRSQ